MSTIELNGTLICKDVSDDSIVERFLPKHVALSRDEPGCLRFEVTQSDDPLVWNVSEQFTDQASFDSHQARVKASEWGHATSHIPCDYTIARPEEAEMVDYHRQSPSGSPGRDSDGGIH
ncbi:quinol monooxygenase YgiN [Brevibacterium paucivorans]|uniref:Quinol monooxygenase YgiN n=1 Tax=Brevibacterium paucivorans TaxID=170994 RepID=A0ABS2SHK8_9MICO|nr:antibiotic biosynthesis monooxygenase [Brevibacterium paucivorans]MBM7815721.1 quinol monooxygenase YgiN [Brevibacterium paucivorans]